MTGSAFYVNNSIDGSDRLPILQEIDLNLSVEQVFSWLKMTDS